MGIKPTSPESVSALLYQLTHGRNNKLHISIQIKTFIYFLTWWLCLTTPIECCVLESISQTGIMTMQRTS